jgi:DNA-binding MarR family transcriptional regulator
MALAHDLEAGGEGNEKPIAARRFEPSDAVIVELARQIYHARKQRPRIMSCADLFGEPAWDMLLELFIAAHERRDVTVTAACRASRVPISTAKRTLDVLQRREIVLKHGDAQDRRRVFVRLSPRGLAEFNRYFRSIADSHTAFVALRPSKRGEKLEAAVW